MDDALVVLLKRYATSPSCALTRPALRKRHEMSRRLVSGLAASVTSRHARSTGSHITACNGRRRRGYGTGALPKDIAILGGGLTGLTTAFYLTRFHPGAKITIYETAERLGGWVDTERVDVKSDEGVPGTVVFERGPRTVAPQNRTAKKHDDLILYEMVWRFFFVLTGILLIS